MGLTRERGGTGRGVGSGVGVGSRRLPHPIPGLGRAEGAFPSSLSGVSLSFGQTDRRKNITFHRATYTGGNFNSVFS